MVRSEVFMKRVFLGAALSALLAAFLGCSEGSEGVQASQNGFTLQEIDLRSLKWDQPDDRYRIGLHFVIVKLSKDVDTDKSSIVALDTLCPKDGLCLPVLYLEKILHCPGCTSDFDFRGIRLRGPASEDLRRYKIGRDTQTGKILVFLRTTFTHAEGGWKKPDSFLPVE